MDLTLDNVLFFNSTSWTSFVPILVLVSSTEIFCIHGDSNLLDYTAADTVRHTYWKDFSTVDSSLVYSRSPMRIHYKID